MMLNSHEKFRGFPDADATDSLITCEFSKSDAYFPSKNQWRIFAD